MRNFSRILGTAALLCLAVPSIALADWWDTGKKIEGRGTVAEDTRDVSGFDAVDLGTMGTIFIEQGDAIKLTVQAEENLLEYIRTDVRSRTLVIRTENGVSLQPHEPIEYHLTVPTLEEVTISSSGDGVVGDFKTEYLQINIESSGDLDWGAIMCPRLDIRLESSGDLYIDRWDGEKLRAELSSSGDLKIRGGRAKEQEIDINSSGDYHAADLETESASVRTSSSGDAKVRVSDYLYARTSSSGDIVYYGRPEVNGRSTSSGDIIEGGR
jgi:hypothetical protein